MRKFSHGGVRASRLAALAKYGNISDGTCGSQSTEENSRIYGFGGTEEIS